MANQDKKVHAQYGCRKFLSTNDYHCRRLADKSVFHTLIWKSFVLHARMSEQVSNTFNSRAILVAHFSYVQLQDYNLTIKYYFVIYFYFEGNESTKLRFCQRNFMRVLCYVVYVLRGNPLMCLGPHCMYKPSKKKILSTNYCYCRCFAD